MRTKLAKKWSIQEASLVAIPADRSAVTRSRDSTDTGRVAVNREIRALGKQCQVTDDTVNGLIDRSATLEEAQAALLQAMTTRSKS